MISIMIDKETLTFVIVKEITNVQIIVIVKWESQWKWEEINRRFNWEEKDLSLCKWREQHRD